MIKHFPKNPNGRDFAIGDIHGCYGQLTRILASRGFDTSRDRLFSVGDLIDRGPESERVAELLTEPWFQAVRGNHEAMAISMLDVAPDHDTYRRNGGDWFLQLPLTRQRALAARFNALPIGLDIETSNGLVGVVHAEMTASDWASFCAALMGSSSAEQSQAPASPPSPAASSTSTPARSSIVSSFFSAKRGTPTASERTRNRLIDAALWSRDRILHSDRRRIPDLHALVVGHTPVPRMTTLGNVYYIDTGAVFHQGPLTMIDLADLT